MVQIVPDRGPSEQATKNGVRPYDMIHTGGDEMNESDAPGRAT